jgi:hypothetical protein
LRNKEKIKTESLIDSDEFNDLLVIEKAVSDLAKLGLLSPKDILILEYLYDGKTITSAKDNLGIDRGRFSINFKRLCRRVAFYLGDYFTDDGYIEYMTKKYNLTEGQVDIMKTVIFGNRNNMRNKKSNE